jgi:hypothetical protein
MPAPGSNLLLLHSCDTKLYAPKLSPFVAGTYVNMNELGQECVVFDKGLNVPGGTREDLSRVQR